MAFVSPKMGLRVWNQLSDNFDHDQLADNWAKVDYHDHTPGRGVLIPTEGIADGAVTSAKLAANTIDASRLLDGSVTSAKILDGAVTDTDLASPNNVTYKQIVSLSPVAQALTSGQTYLLSPIQPFSSFSNSIGGGLFYLDPGDYAVAGKTTKYRLKVTFATNATAPTSTFTFGLYPVSSVAGTSNIVTPTLGAVTSGSTVAFAAQAASTLGQGNSGDFTPPAAGYFVLAVAVTAANQATNSAATITATLQQRAV